MTRPPPPLPGTYLPAIPEQDRAAALLLHLSPLLIVLLGILPGAGNILGPLAAWLLLRQQSPVLDQQGKEVLNFQLSLLIYTAALTLLAGLLLSAGVLGGLTGAALGADWLAQFSVLGSLGGLALLLLPALFLLYLVPLVALILAVFQVAQGRAYRYPLTLRLLR
ncbi:DUF4870 domain-containing protein [Deinococcus lacus]|uniref:DUF4870 domain-containing protein n=1 Tax=Deinococcus lacus TaxID=392561 RepID=A0ABW1Y902_9DEIO